MRRFFFITGLPRSGSTLFSAILRQNPQFEAGMTSPVGSITAMLKVAMSSNIEISSLMTNEGRMRILRGVFEGYYAHLPEDTVVFDTNRGWSGRIEELLYLFGDDVKMIALVRDPAWIMDSVERIVRKNPLLQSRMVQPGSTLKARAEALMSNDGLIGSSLGHLSSALSGPNSGKVLLLEYDALVHAPATAMQAVYKFLNLKHFDHQFDNVSYEMESFDELLMTPDLHKVSGPVKVIERETILPLEIFERLSSAAFWKSDIKTNAPMVVLK